jgi:hypothetical protein
VRLDVAQQIDDREAAVGDCDHLPAGQPAGGLQQCLARLVGQFLVPLSLTSFHTSSVDFVYGCSRDNKIAQAL